MHYHPVAEEEAITMPIDGRMRLLAVSHEASRTGAPIVLASLLEWLHRHENVSIHTLLIEDGPLRDRFESVGTVSAVTELPGAELLGFAERGLIARGARRARRVPSALRYLPAVTARGRYDTVYLNSLTTVDVVPFLREPTRVFAHIHEGPMTIASWWSSHAPRTELLARVDRWIAVSEESAAALADLPGIDSDRISLHHPFIDVASISGGSENCTEVRSLHDRFGIPANARVVVGSGTIDRRKGPDLFVQLAAEVRRRTPAGLPPVHFLWVGGDLEGPDWPLLRSDLERTGAAHVHVTGNVADPTPLFRLADVFVLTSREDPFPLVCLEHAALGVPVVAYDSSGIRTFLANAGPLGSRCIVDYLDVGAMASRVLELLASPSLARDTGAELTKAVSSAHDIAAAGPAIAAELGL